MSDIQDTMDEFIFTNFITGGTNAAVDNRRNVLAIKLARTIGLESEVVDLILRRRRKYLTEAILQQRKWGTYVSRRPQRGRHHDSWATREAYVRADNSGYGKHLPYGHAVRDAHAERTAA